MAKKLSVNAPCPCKSGKKIKKCCGEAARRWTPVEISPGFVLAGPPRIEMTAVSSQDSSVPQWMLALARRAAASAEAEGASEGDALMTLLLVTTAGEAILNRILEPLVPADEWERNGRSKGIEMMATPDKWIELSKRLKLDPPFTRGTPPLQRYLKTVDARHTLVHFKHGRNVRHFESEPKRIPWDGGVHIDLSELSSMETKPVNVPEVEPVLDPKSAKEYFESLRALLGPVIEALPDELAEFGGALTRALGSERGGGHTGQAETKERHEEGTPNDGP